MAQLVKNLPAVRESWVWWSLQCKDLQCEVPGLGRSRGEGTSYPLQYSGLENPMDCIVQGVPKSWTRLSDLHFTSIIIPWQFVRDANSQTLHEYNASKTLDVGPSNLCFNRLSRKFWWTWNLRTTDFEVMLVGKNLPANAGNVREAGSIWVGKILWRRTWQPTPVFLPGDSHGQRSLAGYSPQVCTESDMTEVT